MVKNKLHGPSLSQFRGFQMLLEDETRGISIKRTSVENILVVDMAMITLPPISLVTVAPFI